MKSKHSKDFRVEISFENAAKNVDIIDSATEYQYITSILRLHM